MDRWDRAVKAWWRSRTLWINAAVVAVAMLGAALDSVRDALGPAGYMLAIAAVAVVNMALRKVTREPLAPLRKRKGRGDG